MNISKLVTFGALGAMALAMSACVSAPVCKTEGDYAIAKQQWRKAGIPLSAQPKYEDWRCGNAEPQAVKLQKQPDTPSLMQGQGGAQGGGGQGGAGPGRN